MTAPQRYITMDFDMWARFFEHSYLYGVALPLGGNRFQPDQKTASGIDRYYEEAGRILAGYRSRGGALLRDNALKVVRYNFREARWSLEG